MELSEIKKLNGGVATEITEEQWELAHLGLDEVPETLPNPLLDDLTDYDLIHPTEHLLSVMMNPDYFGWTCSKLFNTAVTPNGLELLPLQCAILRELWWRPFPVIIGSRGLGKSFLLGLYSLLRAVFIPGRKIVITGAGFRQSKIVLAYAEALWNNSPVFRELCGAGKNKAQGIRHEPDKHWIQVGESTVVALPIGDGCLGKMSNIAKNDCFSTIEFPVKSIWGNGKFRNSDEHYINGFKPTKVITTKRGFSYEGTYNHAMKVCRNGIVDWVRSDEMVIGDKILIDRTYRWHNGKSNISENDAYVLGCLVGDGSYTTNDILRYATKDHEFIPKINEFIHKYFSSSLNMKWAGEKDDCHYTLYTAGICSDICRMFGMKGRRTIDKTFPKEVLKAERNKVSFFISGLFDCDGTLQINTAKGGTGVTVSFTNTSKTLVDQLQFILLHFGIVSTRSFRNRKTKEGQHWNTVYELHIHGPEVIKFHKEIGFKLKRKNDLLEVGLKAKIRNYGNGDSIPDIQTDIVSIARSYKIKKGMGDGDTLTPSKLQKIKSVSHNLANRFLKVYGFTNDPRLQRIKELADPNIFYDEIISIEDSEAETFDIHVPEGNEYCTNGFFSHNSKIRGQRAHDILADEFASINPRIFEEVIAGFGVVNIDPISQVKHHSRMKYLKNAKQESGEDSIEGNLVMPNQMILSGTANFSFNHFYTYWKKHKNIILTRGDEKKMKQLSIDPKLDHKKYSVIRVPVDVLPKGFMDQAQIDRSRATMQTGIFETEFGAIFTDDSHGFFPRSIIEKAMPSYRLPVITPAGNVVEMFAALLRGDISQKYIMAIDTASQRDNFAIAILEVHPDHARIVHIWTTNSKQHTDLRGAGGTEEKDFYAYCVRKIRDLMKLFNVIHISMDSQGGGRTISELLHNEKYVEDGEVLIWEMDKTSPLWDGKSRETDAEAGRHILELVNFADAKYTSDANHGMKNDLEQKTLLFPYSDAIEIVVAGKSDFDENRRFDTLEDVLMEIDELKDELSMIVHDATTTGRERWGAPKVKGTSGLGDLHDDRYSALLMANFAARRLRAIPERSSEYVPGGFVGFIPQPIQSSPLSRSAPEPLYTGPAWATKPLNALTGYGLVKRGD